MWQRAKAGHLRVALCHGLCPPGGPAHCSSRRTLCTKVERLQNGLLSHLWLFVHGLTRSCSAQGDTVLAQRQEPASRTRGGGAETRCARSEPFPLTSFTPHTHTHTPHTQAIGLVSCALARSGV